jgi:DNA-binding PadR family transcriptional regulator
MELSSTAYVILGMLNWRPRSGYEIKSAVDNSTRFFWAASYSQIYPELKRLEKQGLVEGEAAPKGGRRRRVFKITAAGRRELRKWLDKPAETFELRDEGLLKLFFSGSASPGRGVELLREKAAAHAAGVERLREIEPELDKDGYPYLVLRNGIEFNEWAAEWFERAAREFARKAKAAA